MTRFQNFEEIYSALYVDFDNIYIRLKEQDPSLAHTFATHPQRWLRWLEGHALRMMYGDGVRRRILKRCCYINPIRFQEFRPFFIRSAFQVVDCPPLTNLDKTTADIHLVMDCMDTLNHATRFDEFIILSGDADFTPLLFRIQEHARRTLVLSVGYTSPAYAAACSWRIREDWFLSQALEECKDDGDIASEAFHTDRRTERSHTTKKERSTTISLPVYQRIRLVECIKQLVAESSVPVPLPSVAQTLQREQEASPDWFGAGTLRELLEILDLSPIVFNSNGEGFVYDPGRHIAPNGDENHADFHSRHPDLYEFALKIHRLTDVPFLTPTQYDVLFHAIMEEVNAYGFSRTGSVRNIESRCIEENVPAGTPQVAFVVEAIIRGGINLASSGKQKEKLTATKLRQAFSKSVNNLCKLAQAPLPTQHSALLDHWFQNRQSKQKEENAA